MFYDYDYDYDLWFGIKGPKVCNIHLHHHHQEPQLLLQGKNDPCMLFMPNSEIKIQASIYSLLQINNSSQNKDYPSECNFIFASRN